MRYLDKPLIDCTNDLTIAGQVCDDDYMLCAIESIKSIVEGLNQEIEAMQGC